MIRLEPFTEADVDRLIGWLPDAAFLIQWGGPGFAQLGLHRVSLNVFAHNRAAIARYRSLGFSIEGTVRESCRVGDQYWSGHIMGILEDEWRALEASTPR